MSSMKGKVEKKNWAQINALRKLRRKQFREKKLMKELEPAEQKDESTEKTPGYDLAALKDMKTISIAVPGSILDNAQSPLLQTYLVGQIARAACIYNVDEIVVFNDMGDTPSDRMIVGDEETTWKSCALMGRILEFLECPQYLRKFIFPIHKDFQFTGLLNPLDAPHHLRLNDESVFREGIITDKPTKKSVASYANIGLHREVAVDKALLPGTRVTVKLFPKQEGEKKIKGILVPPSLPRLELGVYWGYQVRLAKSLDEVLTGCPHEGCYDLLIGTSDRGAPVDQTEFPSDFKHAIVIFGGLEGLEGALESDEVLSEKYDDVAKLFHHYVNTCPKQGARTIRTEEAILISLAHLTNKLSL